MATDGESTSPQPLPQQLLGLTLKHAAFVFAIVYGIGFLILSIHHGRLGMDPLDPLKPKVFSAGLLFVVMAGVSCVAMARLQGLFGLRMPNVKAVPAQRIGLIKLSWALDFWSVAFGLRIACALLFKNWEMIPNYPGILFYIADVVLTVVSRPLFDLNKSPTRTTLMHLALTAFGVAIIFRYMSHSFFLQVLWLYGVGLMFLWTHSLWHGSERQTFDWERQVFSILGLIGFFAIFVYGQVRSIYGGGAPISVDLILTRPTLFSSDKASRGLLVDEDAHGYYLIHKEDETEAHFIPRDAVAEIVFHGQTPGFDPNQK